MEAAAAERQFVVPGTSLGSIEHVNANASGNKSAARTSERVRMKERGSSRILNYIYERKQPRI